MRTLQRNKRPLMYSNLVKKEGTLITDKEGNLLETGENKYIYSEPDVLKANIVQSGQGYAEAVEFGLDKTDYDAVIVATKNKLPIVEGSLIWDKSEPMKDRFGTVRESSADYRVAKVSDTVNVDKFLLKRLVNGS